MTILAGSLGVAFLVLLVGVQALALSRPSGTQRRREVIVLLVIGTAAAALLVPRGILLVTGT